jgi:hypothetical protein
MMKTVRLAKEFMSGLPPLADQFVNDGKGPPPDGEPEKVRLEPFLMISAACCNVMRLLLRKQPECPVL